MISNTLNRNCPKCSKELKYCNKYARNNAEKSGGLCQSCGKINPLKGDLLRTCPTCEAQIGYTRQGDKNYGKKNNSSCKKCATKNVQFKKGVGCNILAERSIPKYNLDFLLDETINSYYFLGLIISDGSFYKNRFEITLKVGDLYILQELSVLSKGAPIKSKFVKGREYCRLMFNNKDSVELIMNHFGFNYNKTYNPLNFDKFKLISYDKLFAMFIGMLDGDGSIYINKTYKSPSITLIFHNVWEGYYKELFNNLGIFYTRTNKNNCVVFAINRTLEIIKIRDLKDILKIQGLSRKWSKLNNLKINEKIKNSYRM